MPRLAAACGDYGGCDSAGVARLGGSHAARGGRGGCSSARTMSAQREVQLVPHNNYYINAAPQILVIKRLPH